MKNINLILSNFLEVFYIATPVKEFHIYPMEQFQIYPLIPLRIGSIDISLTNAFILSGIIVIATVFLGLVLIFDRGFKIIPSYWQSISEVLHKFTLELVKENIAHERAEYFFPWVLTIFALLLSMNLIGLVTYSFTLTSHIIVTFTIALGAFLGVNYVALKKHGLKALKIFLPAGGHFALVFILVPIELISYFFKPISLALRLFANMMAGHSLLKIFVLVVDTIMEIKYPYGFFLTFVPLFFLVILFFLELIVTVIQAYVFAVIISMYINDALNVY